MKNALKERTTAIRSNKISSSQKRKLDADWIKISLAFGIWKNKPVDALAYQKKIRAEWSV